MDSQLQLNEERMEILAKFRQALPDLAVNESARTKLVYSNGALSAKVKRLIALAIAVRAGCTNPILAQTMRALEAGATKDEILEALSVNVTLSGTTGIGESLRVIKLLDELGKL